jgi:hypothetical protein
MNESRECSSCGCELQPDSLSGLCPECLISVGLTSGNANGMQAGLDNVLTPQPGLFVPPKPDSLKAHFPQLEILESLGHGGMGPSTRRGRQNSTGWWH